MHTQYSKYTQDNNAHTGQLQQYTRPNQQQLHTRDKLKLATIYVRQIRIQHVQKVKTPREYYVICLKIHRKTTQTYLSYHDF